MGEVGSGKTVVALYAMLRALEAGFQGVLMAPTEALAEQHAPDPRPPAGRRAAVLRAAHRCGSAARHREPSSGWGRRARLAVGTHALIAPGVEFARLAALRRRRAAPLRGRAARARSTPRASRGWRPTSSHDRDPDPAHALAHRLRRPRHHRAARAAGRPPPVETRLVEEDERAGAYEFLRAQLREGRQAYVVCPLVSSRRNCRAGRPSGGGAAGRGELASSASASCTARCPRRASPRRWRLRLGRDRRAGRHHRDRGRDRRRRTRP